MITNKDPLDKADLILQEIIKMRKETAKILLKVSGHEDRITVLEAAKV